VSNSSSSGWAQIFETKRNGKRISEYGRRCDQEEDEEKDLRLYTFILLLLLLFFGMFAFFPSFASFVFPSSKFYNRLTIPQSTLLLFVGIPTVPK
jgi:hypothetical protein